MARLTLVRHGEASAGWGDDPDPGLSELGHRQGNGSCTVLDADGGALRLVGAPPMTPWARRWLRTDDLPRDTTGKVLERDLRESFPTGDQR